jgi:hypothetical protein
VYVAFSAPNHQSLSDEFHLAVNNNDTVQDLPFNHLMLLLSLKKTPTG